MLQSWHAEVGGRWVEVYTASEVQAVLKQYAAGETKGGGDAEGGERGDE